VQYGSGPLRLTISRCSSGFGVAAHGGDHLALAIQDRPSGSMEALVDTAGGLSKLQRLGPADGQLKFPPVPSHQPPGIGSRETAIKAWPEFVRSGCGHGPSRHESPFSLHRFNAGRLGHKWCCVLTRRRRWIGWPQPAAGLALAAIDPGDRRRSCHWCR